MIDITPFGRGDLSHVVALCAGEGWTDYAEDPDRAFKALTAPGVTTLVASDADRVVGFVSIHSDGLIQAHLTVLAVEKAYRGQGIGQRLVTEALRRGGGERLNLLATSGFDQFWEAFPHETMVGYRLIPNRYEG
jgi:ribosomal protein S18 acetylase RimI-like enzyme